MQHPRFGSWPRFTPVSLNFGALAAASVFFFLLLHGGGRRGGRRRVGALVEALRLHVLPHVLPSDRANGLTFLPKRSGGIFDSVAYVNALLVTVLAVYRVQNARRRADPLVEVIFAVLFPAHPSASSLGTRLEAICGFRQLHGALRKEKNANEKRRRHVEEEGARKGRRHRSRLV